MALFNRSDDILEEEKRNNEQSKIKNCKKQIVQKLSGIAFKRENNVLLNHMVEDK